MEMQKPSSEESQLIDKDDSEDERQCSRCCLFPLSCYFIVVNEFCERFCYYGMRAVLVLYLTQYIGLHSSNAMGLYHFWVVLTYMTPLLGGYIADNYLGKFYTILILSVVYLVGTIVMAATAAIPPNLPGPIVGLLLIAFGSGGIKSSTSAFGGDQINPNKRNLLDSFFSVFYFTINAGAVISTIITPLFRAKVHCAGKDTCYPLAFGMSSVLMAIAIIVFAVGKSRYIIRPQGDRAVGKLFTCTWHGFVQYVRRNKKVADPDAEWMDYASDKYSEEDISNVKRVHSIIVLFLPMIIFWSIYDQQSSRWTLQANHLDGYVAPGITLLPDQMAFVNALLIMLFIPLFESVFYPLVAKCGIKDKPLRRMVAGLLLTIASFVVAFFLQLRVEKELIYPPDSGFARLKLVSMQPGCNLGVSNKLLTNEAFNASAAGIYPISTTSLTFHLKCKSGSNLQNNLKLNLKDRQDYLIFGWVNSGKLMVKEVLSEQKKPKNGMGLIRTAYIAGRLPFVNLTLSSGPKDFRNIPLINNMTASGGLVVTPFIKMKRNSYNVILAENATKSIYLGYHLIENGEVTTFLPHKAKTWILSRVVEVRGNTISILWQLPQYVLITAGEILVSITGLSFSYAEAPDSLKATVSSIWLVYTGLGNLIVAIVSELNLFNRESWNYVLFSILGVLTTIIFALLAYMYNPREQINYISPLNLEEEKKEVTKEE